MNARTTDGAPTARPQLSVVVASSNDEVVLRQCVTALAQQVSNGDIEVIVVRAADRPATIDRQRLPAQTPAFHWIEAPALSTVPRLRGLGIASSQAEHIAMLEDDCVVNPDWSQQALAAREQAIAVGGAVEPNGYDRALDWAVYFAEYGRFMLPLTSTPNAPLTGNNVIYSRRAILSLPHDLRANFQETIAHAAWHRAGVPTAVNGALVVRNVNSWTARHITSVPFHHGRAFAGQRFEGTGVIVRLGFALLVPALPALKVLRIVAETIRRRRLVGSLLKSLPWILVFVVSWSAGELAGCLRGPGDSPSRWR